MLDHPDITFKLSLSHVQIYDANTVGEVSSLKQPHSLWALSTNDTGPEYGPSCDTVSTAHSHFLVLKQSSGMLGQSHLIYLGCRFWTDLAALLLLLFKVLLFYVCWLSPGSS